MTTPANQLLDQIFHDSDTKYKLDLFKAEERNQLQLFEKEGKIRVRCKVRNRDFVAKPEEVVRQLVINHLHYTLQYPLSQMKVEVQVKMGSSVHKKAADVVVYDGPHYLRPYIIVEVKKPGRKDGRDQLHSYMNATGAPFGMWTNGSTGMQGVAYERRTEPNFFTDLPRLPRADESLDDVLEPIRKKDLKPADDLLALVKQMQEEVLANAGVNVFEEVFKLFFAKLWDEESATDLTGDPSSVCNFRITAEDADKQFQRFNRLLHDACQEYPDIFPVGTQFKLSPEAMLVVVSVLENVRLMDTDLELIDLTFEHLMSPESKGDKGQYFTPRQVVQMAVKMLNPKMNESLLDPACGPCGFPLHALLHVRDQELRRKFPHNWETKLPQYASTHLFATDFDDRVIRVAKFMLRLAGDGRSNVYHMNSLDPREWRRSQTYQRVVADKQFDLILTNPPFAGDIRPTEILNNYDLALNETLRRTGGKDELHVIRERKLNTQTRDVLFLDYCLNKLKPGGRMAIVLPQGHFNNLTAEQTRRTIMSRGRILAVVGLHVNAFKPHTGTKTSVLFVQRWDGEEAEAWKAWYEALYEQERATAEYEALCKWREKLLNDGLPEAELPLQILVPPQPPDPPPTPLPITPSFLPPVSAAAGTTAAIMII